MKSLDEKSEIIVQNYYNVNPKPILMDILCLQVIVIPLRFVVLYCTTSYKDHIREEYWVNPSKESSISFCVRSLTSLLEALC